jgi:3-phenylpropionate/trans-cinnamate dioxygenase ferredoxin subunit
MSEAWFSAERGAPGVFKRACALSELSEGESLAVDMEGEPVAIVRTEGEVFAIRDVCSHAEIPLTEGEVDGYTIECWLHGSCFDLRTGEPTNMPATVSVPVYPVRIDGDDVLVSLTPENTVSENIRES